MSGDINIAKQTIRKFCFSNGLCVTIKKTDFIYTGGEESGFVVGLINYPKYPKTNEEIAKIAHDLANALLADSYQHSVLIQTPNETEWISFRSAIQ